MFKGMARPGSAWPGSVIEVCGGVPDLKPYPYAPGEARRLIQEAGYEGYEFGVPSYKRPVCPEFQELVEVVCGYWEKIGLKPKIFMSDWSIFQEKLRTGNTQGTICGMDSSQSPSVPSLLVRMKERTYSKYKRSIIQDPKVDEMFDKASSSLDPAEVAKILVDVYLYHYNQYHFIPICHINREYATTQRIPEWDLGGRRQDRNFNGLIRQP
jgi:ABC-type transport system substrate-binding protein